MVERQIYKKILTKDSAVLAGFNSSEVLVFSHIVVDKLMEKVFKVPPFVLLLVDY